MSSALQEREPVSENPNRLQILTFVNYYLPGNKGGGPVRSIANIVDRLGDEFSFKIATMDRDSGDQTPYPGITTGDWRSVGKAEVSYICPSGSWTQKVLRILREPHDVLYLNSCFDRRFTLQPLLLHRLGLVPRAQVIVAPRGEFSPGALGIKPIRKRLFQWLARTIGLYSGVVWQASSSFEAEDIFKWVGSGGRHAPVIVAPDVVPVLNLSEPKSESSKQKGQLRIIFLSRITEKKNLIGALQMLDGLTGQIEFTICGPINDPAYWADCQKVAQELPSNIQVAYRKTLAHEEVRGELVKHQLFLFPTLGENFGHVIFEAMSCGLPVMISDQTPWRDLIDRKAGWDLSLNQEDRFRSVLQECVDMDEAEFREWRSGASACASQVALGEETVDLNRHLFSSAGRKNGGLRAEPETTSRAD